MSVSDIASGVFGGIADFIGNLGSSLLDFIISLIANVINIVFLPIDALIKTIFPDFSILISNFNSTLSTTLNSSISFIMYHIPPMTKYALLFYITLLIGYYSIKYIYKGIILIPKLIQKIKFW